MTALLVGRVPVTAHPLVQSSFPMPSTTEPPFLRPSLERRVSLMFFFVVVLLSSLQAVEAHLAAWHRAMYCLDGTNPNQVDSDTTAIVQPLYQMKEVDWWFHHSNKCDEFPPSPGVYLDLPANGEFTVEHAVNRAFTTLSYNGTRTALFGDGKDHPSLGVTADGKVANDSCISDPNIHTQNETMAAGTAFAISYVSDLKHVTKDNLVVFTVLYHTPWRRLATYKVPDLPACPQDGCICAWGWVPNGCGIPNMYMQGFRCRVVGSPTGDAALSTAVPPVWCEDDQTKCIKGAKQMVYWHQLEGNNVVVDGQDLSGQPKSPSYNKKMGFADGAQTDIFKWKGSASPQYIQPNDTSGLTAGATSLFLNKEHKPLLYALTMFLGTVIVL